MSANYIRTVCLVDQATGIGHNDRAAAGKVAIRMRGREEGGGQLREPLADMECSTSSLS